MQIRVSVEITSYLIHQSEISLWNLRESKKLFCQSSEKPVKTNVFSVVSGDFNLMAFPSWALLRIRRHSFEQWVLQLGHYFSVHLTVHRSLECSARFWRFFHLSSSLDPRSAIRKLRSIDGNVSIDYSTIHFEVSSHYKFFLSFKIVFHR